MINLLEIKNLILWARSQALGTASYLLYLFIFFGAKENE